LFFSPGVFPHWVRRLNSRGLFDSVPDSLAFKQDYDKAADARQVEELPLDVDVGIAPVRIGRVQGWKTKR
jgi:hypothetical protein